MSMNQRIKDWRELRVWLVGASSGIGSALAQDLLRRGARVILSARRREPLEDVAATNPDHALVLELDVTEANDWQRALRQVQDQWGGVDLVIFLAGAYQPSRAWQLADTPYEKIIATNLTGSLHGLRHLVPALLEQGHGGLALVASVAGYRGLPQATVYGASKAAVINLAESLYFDLAPRGLSVYLINPGFVRTPLTAENEFHMPALIEPEEAADTIRQGLERGRFEIHFPRRFTGVMKLLGHLPARLYFWLLHKGTGL